MPQDNPEAPKQRRRGNEYRHTGVARIYTLSSGKSLR
jgi:hypothetical protein